MGVQERIELERLAIQEHLDNQRSAFERNTMGQFATPTQLALDILTYARDQIGADAQVSFFDPAFGTGSFYSALLEVFPASQIESATAFEVDPHYGLPAAKLWGSFGLDLRIADFTTQPVDQKHTLTICNPPYIRHHHIPGSDKLRLKHATRRASGMNLSGLAGMYCHFLGLAHPWMEPNGLAAWLIPSEFMDVNYGTEVKRYLTNEVNLLHIHRFDPRDAQFDDAIVSSCIVWFRNEHPDARPVTMSFGGSLAVPRESVTLSKSQLKAIPKWTQATRPVGGENRHHPRIADWFRIRRGIATGDNSFFVVSKAQANELQLPPKFLTPILPPPRQLDCDEVQPDLDGLPSLRQQLFLIDCDLPQCEVERHYPALWAYLETGRARGVPETYLTSRRKPWYSQEKRTVPPLVCTYMGRPTKQRSSPFRFIRNRSSAIAANVYLLFEPKPELLRVEREHPDIIDQIWRFLNSLSEDELMGYGRTYGGGLHKLEPRELMNLPLGDGIDPLMRVPIIEQMSMALDM